MEKRNFIRDINEFRAICTLSATNNFSETVYRKENKGNVSTLSLILTPFSPPCCFRGNKRGEEGGKYISPEIVVRLVITANEIFIEKFAAINLAPVIIFHLFDQRSVISSYDGAEGEGGLGRFNNSPVSFGFLCSEGGNKRRWRVKDGEEDCPRRHD